jgi:hypothetical protein
MVQVRLYRAAYQSLMEAIKVIIGEWFMRLQVWETRCLLYDSVPA